MFTSAFLAALNFFDPIINFMIAILIIFIVDLLLGIISGRKLNKEPISFKKGFSAVILFGAYIMIVSILFIIGELMCDQKIMSYMIKTISWATIYFYSVNSAKNLKRIFPNSKLIAFLYYFLNIEFLDNFPSLKRFLKRTESEK